MHLPGQLQGAPAGLVGFDTDTSLSSETVKKFTNDGYKFCIRYVSIGPQELPRDLTYDEAKTILEAGLALMPVQHVRFRGWMPGESLGRTDGGNTARHMQAIGFPQGVNSWCDLEGVSPSASPQDIIAYCDAWHDAVSAAGYIPGLYVGW
jgi:hypothetical protein